MFLDEPVRLNFIFIFLFNAAKCTSIADYCGRYGNKCSSDDPPRCSCGTTGAQCSTATIPYCYNSAGTQVDNDDGSTCKV